MEAALEAGHEPPKEVQNKPVIFEGLVEVWRAFWWLDRRRQSDQGIPQPISVEALSFYVERFGESIYFFDMKDAEELGGFLDLITDMDEEFLAYQYEKLKGGKGG